MSYLLHGRFPLREGATHDGAVLLSWGTWTPPEADNDDEWEDDNGPQRA